MLNSLESQKVLSYNELLSPYPSTGDLGPESALRGYTTGKDPDAGRVWGQEDKGTTEDGMFGWDHRLNGHEFG